MIGEAWIRGRGMKDPLLAAMARARGQNAYALSNGQTPKPEKDHWYQARLQLEGRRDGAVAEARRTFDSPREATTLLKSRATELGADIVGVARMSPHYLEKGKELDHEFIFCIGARERYEPVLAGCDAVEVEAFRAYYESARIAVELANDMRAMGYSALAHFTGASEILALPALYDAGFGELGKHGSLIHPTYGASFRPGFVTTNLPLEPDAPYEFGVQDRCLSCRLCVNNCPGDAIPNEFVITRGIRRWLTDVEKCYPYSRLREEYCHICVDVCPYVIDSAKSLYKTFMQSRKADGYKAPRTR